MTVDISKIKPGDTVHVRLTVRFVQTSHVGVKTMDGLNLPSMKPEDIVSHIPKPHEWKVGDRVTWGTGNVGHVIRGLHAGKAWLGGSTTVTTDILEAPHEYTRFDD